MEQNSRIPCHGPRLRESSLLSTARDLERPSPSRLAEAVSSRLLAPRREPFVTRSRSQNSAEKSSRIKKERKGRRFVAVAGSWRCFRGMGQSGTRYRRGVGQDEYFAASVSGLKL